jgi:hypothetical protein
MYAGARAAAMHTPETILLEELWRDGIGIAGIFKGLS